VVAAGRDLLQMGIQLMVGMMLVVLQMIVAGLLRYWRINFHILRLIQI